MKKRLLIALAPAVPSFMLLLLHLSSSIRQILPDEMFHFYYIVWMLLTLFSGFCSISGIATGLTILIISFKKHGSRRKMAIVMLLASCIALLMPMYVWRMSPY